MKKKGGKIKKKKVMRSGTTTDWPYSRRYNDKIRINKSLI
jgi:hypothetical protein